MPINQSTFFSHPGRQCGLARPSSAVLWRKVWHCEANPSLSLSLQSFTDLQHRPQLVDLTVEEGQRLKVIYGSSVGFHVIDVDSGNPYDIYIPSHVSPCVCE